MERKSETPWKMHTYIFLNCGCSPTEVPVMGVVEITATVKGFWICNDPKLILTQTRGDCEVFGTYLCCPRIVLQSWFWTYSVHTLHCAWHHAAHAAYAWLVVKAVTGYLLWDSTTYKNDPFYNSKIVQLKNFPTSSPRHVSIECLF